ncbi:hypothetical protein BLL42_14500 [Pseudomonas frederiksbergensis]|uniref:Lipoprotein n=1 Tax=Pseudomonas frederiksbergensis TaxID=104087 RepID=A0A1J0ELU1_9PSED|nr:hypothetical protein [Pseudomonas frederiksbergensis]APC16883.1 hypothetical protein BLL42_14500 [Pseudomonas frederiksbergensis]
MKISNFVPSVVFRTCVGTALLLITGLAFAGGQDSADARSEGEGCYGYLTEMVRSSDFPFRYTTKDKINLLIDDDNGERVLAQLFYKTSGEGIVGWVKYYIQDETLFNASADLDEPVELKYDKKYAALYKNCISKLNK